MTNSILLTKDDLTELLKINGFWEAKYGASPKFYAKFLNQSIQNISNIDMEYYQEALKLSEQNLYSSHGSVSQDSKDFVKLFDKKISLPESFTIFKLLGDFYGSQKEKAMYKEIFSFFENKIGEKSLHSMMENYLYKYGNDNSSILSYWFNLSEKNPSWTDINKANQIINNTVAEHSFNTTSRKLNLKMLCFLNQFIDNKDSIVKYIERNQSDAVFLKNAEKITGGLKDITWNQKDIPVIKAKKIIGTIALDSNSFVQSYQMSRGDADRFISSSLSFIARRFKEINASSTSYELVIYASSIDDYKCKEEQAEDKINKIKMLAPLWEKSKDRSDDYEFFNNYFNKISLNDELNKELNSAEINKTTGKKTKI